MRAHELDAHDGRLHSSDYQKHERIKDVQDAEPFVIDRDHPLVQCLH